MTTIHETITQLNIAQIRALLDIIGKVFKPKTSPLNSIEQSNNHHLIQSTHGDFARLTLHALIEKDAEIKIFIQKQIANNRQYLATIKEGEVYRSGGEMILVAIGLITTLGIKIDWQVENGKLKKLEIATGLLAIPIINELYKKMKANIEDGNIIIQNKKEINYYAPIDKVFQIENNSGDFNFFKNGNQQEILTEIKQIKTQLNLVKFEILEGIQINNIRLEKSLCLAFQKMSAADLKIVESGLKDLNNLSKINAENIIKEMIKAIHSLSEEFSSEATELSTLLTSKEKISTKLRIAIPFLPFVSVLHEYDANNPLNKWWHSLKNIML